MLDAARALFAERGYAAVTMDDVAAAVGVTKPLLYTYFGNKERLYLACMEPAGEALIDDGRRRRRAAPTAPRRRRARHPRVLRLRRPRPRRLAGALRRDRCRPAARSPGASPSSASAWPRSSPRRALARLPGRAARRAAVEVEALSTALLGAAEALARWWLRTEAMTAAEAADLLDRPNLRARDEHMTTPRRVAVVGGNRIPFARSNGAYANASNQDMLTAALDGLVARFGLEGERLGEVAAGAVLKHSPRLQPHARVRARQPARRRARPPTTSSRRAAPAWRRRSSSPTRSRSARSTPGIAGGVDTTSDAPIAVNEDLREVLLELNRAKSQRRAAQGASRSCAPARSSRRSRATRSRAPACRWASTRRAPPPSGASRARSRTSWPRASHQNLAKAYDARLAGRPRHAVPRPRARPEPAPGLDAPRSSASSSRCSAARTAR